MQLPAVETVVLALNTSRWSLSALNTSSLCLSELAYFFLFWFCYEKQGKLLLFVLLFWVLWMNFPRVAIVSGWCCRTKHGCNLRKGWVRYSSLIVARLAHWGVVSGQIPAGTKTLVGWGWRGSYTYVCNLTLLHATIWLIFPWVGWALMWVILMCC